MCSSLEDALLLEEVTALLSAADACVSKANPTQANTQLLREGFRKTQGLYKAAYRDLKAIRFVAATLSLTTLHANCCR